MHITKRREWRIAEARVTPEPIVMGRRSLLGAAAALALAADGARADEAPAPATPQAPPRNPAFDPGRPLTGETFAETYNNYYEFGEDKNIWRDAQALKQRPWTVKLDGLLSQPRTIGLDDLLKQVSLEERVYRHRCVEGWAMTVPWTGFPLSALLRIAEPLGSARYVVFETVQDPAMPNLRNPIYPWPYVEALTIEEAANELAFISTGLFGKPLPSQNGGPVRLTVPWKYGFKSAKSIGAIRFTEKRPTTFWEAINPDEYRLLGERQPGGAASPLEPGERTPAWNQ